MKLTAKQKYDYRDLDRGEAQLIRVGGMPFGEIASNWAIRSPNKRALTRHSRAFGRRRGNIAWNWPRREHCDSQAIGKPTSTSAMLPKPPFRLETVPLEF
jgi:hypothetical protein